MRQALQEARKAFEDGEVPIGAVVVLNDRIIGRGYNHVERLNDCTAHAEMIALTAAFNTLGSKYLMEATLYVTVEPCLMCVGAAVHARVGTLVYGTIEPRAGAVESRQRAYEHPSLNHKITLVAGVLAEECRRLMLEFFKERR